MRMRLAAATFLVFGAGTAAVGAATITMAGSDTINIMTKDVIANCPGIAPDIINYVGGGSGTAEAQMTVNPPTQTTGPMSRFLQAGPVGNAAAAKACDTDSGTGVNAEGLVVALDGVGIVANTNNSNGCGGVARTKSFNVTDFAETSTVGVDCLPGSGAPTAGSCPGGVYTPGTSPVAAGVAAHEAWGDVIRLAFFGIHHSTAVGGVRDCNSDARRSLVSNYTNLFETSCTGGGTTAPGCQGKPLRHIWRRDDISGTTDVFSSLMGTAFSRLCNVGNTIPASVPVGFSDYFDKDPIRVPCLGNGGNAGDQVCGSAVVGDSYDATKNTISPKTGDPVAANVGTLGLVTVIFVPDHQAAPDPVTGVVKDILDSQLYATTTCDSESLLLEATKGNFSGTCPSGGPSFGGLCFTSVIRTAPPTAPLSTGFNATCFQRNSGATCPVFSLTGVDCRGANLWLRKSDGKIVVDTSLTATGRKMTGAYYRIHQTKAVSGALSCQKPTATEQIGCLVGDADQCTTGYAGRGAFDPVGSATGLLVNNIPPDVDHIRNLISDPANKYPLSRKLYFNSVNGFNNAIRPELELAKCYTSDAVMQVGTTTPANIVTTDGFITLPDRPGKPSRYFCQDFQEQNATSLPQPDTGCGFGAGVNACADNGPIGLPVD